MKELLVYPLIGVSQFCLTKAADSICSYEVTASDGTVEQEQFTCVTGTHCCDRSCCDDKEGDKFYSLWYFWFITLFTIFLIIAVIGTFLQYKYKIMPARRKAEEEEETTRKPRRMVVINGLHPQSSGSGLAPVEDETPLTAPGASDDTGLGKLVTDTLKQQHQPAGKTTVTTVTMETKWSTVVAGAKDSSSPPEVS